MLSQEGSSLVYTVLTIVHGKPIDFMQFPAVTRGISRGRNQRKSVVFFPFVLKCIMKTLKMNSHRGSKIPWFFYLWEQKSHNRTSSCYPGVRQQTQLLKCLHTLQVSLHCHPDRATAETSGEQRAQSSAPHWSPSCWESRLQPFSPWRYLFLSSQWTLTRHWDRSLQWGTSSSNNRRAGTRSSAQPRPSGDMI